MKRSQYSSVVKVIFALALTSFPCLSIAAELKHGRYIGWIELEDRKEKLAVIADFFLESPEDFTKFPRLNATFRISLGGYNTHEYITENFHDLKYDYDFGSLTFDEAGNDLLMTTQVVSANGRTKISGDVFVRSSAVSGKLELWEESDEPGGDSVMSPQLTSSPFASLLEGQYEGVCNETEAAFQIQTIRGLDTRPGSTGMERSYGIGGRLMYKNDPMCGTLPNGQWCSRQHFKNGSFDVYTGRLSFESKLGAEKCMISGDELNCRLRFFTETVECKLRKPTPPQSARFYSRQFHLNPTREQARSVPDPVPPLNQELTQALKGRFFGYLHNETNNTYIPVRLDVTPFSSTENPHNPNKMIVSTTASLFLGRDFSGNFITQRFEPRSFYLRPGFMLSGSTSDSSLSISTWKAGYISGTWISRAFGRVGTFQLVKGSAPALPASAKAVRSFEGEFSEESNFIKRWIRFLFPSRPDNLLEQIIPFTGSYQSIVGVTPVKNIEGGVFDPFTGRLGWRIVNDEAVSLGSGLINDEGEALLFWPPHPIFGTVTRSLEYVKFQRISGE